VIIAVVILPRLRASATLARVFLKEDIALVEHKKSRMVLGFNHNIKHNGRIYHVQTEDSGVDNPHIITHLFVGGNILATKKTSYADIVQAENLEQIVRELMQEQHKAMLRNLINGVYDKVEVPGEAATVQHAGVPALPVDGADIVAGKDITSVPAPVPAASSAPVEAAPDRFPAPAPVPTPASTPAPNVSPRTQVGLPRHEAPTVQAMPAARGQPASGVYPVAPAPESAPPPAPARPPVVLKAGAEKSAGSTPADAKPAERKLPPEVMAARRLAEKPVPRNTSGPTIFGENLITEKSLDEVILSYLSGEEEDG